MPRSLALEIACARAADAAAFIDLRGRTRENAVSATRLTRLGITEDTWAEDIRCGVLVGFTAVQQERLVGYCFGNTQTGEIVVLALLPEVEGRGLGRELLGRVVADLRRWGHRRLFLGCSSDPSVRSHGFYRHLGWQPTGTIDKNDDEVLELHLAPEPSATRAA